MKKNVYFHIKAKIHLGLIFNVVCGMFQDSLILQMDT